MVKNKLVLVFLVLNASLLLTGCFGSKKGEDAASACVPTGPNQSATGEAAWNARGCGVSSGCHSGGLNLRREEYRFQSVTAAIQNNEAMKTGFCGSVTSQEAADLAAYINATVKPDQVEGGYIQ